MTGAGEKKVCFVAERAEPMPWNERRIVKETICKTAESEKMAEDQAREAVAKFKLKYSVGYYIAWGMVRNGDMLLARTIDPPAKIKTPLDKD